MAIKAIDNLPNINWTDNQWIQWHGELKSEFGKNDANTVFLEAWQQRKNAGVLGSSANTNKLRTYLKTQGVDLGADGILAYPMDAFDNVTGFVESAFGVGKTIYFVVGITLFIIIVFFLWNIAKNPGQTIGTAAKYAK